MALRITGGFLRGRIVRVPKAAVRPTQDRVRLALFSMLAARIPGARVLDLFAGSGALGLEAYSRGAASVCWVESNRQTLRVLRQNIHTLCGQAEPGPAENLSRAAVRLVAGDVFGFMRRPAAAGPFDLIFADPPYDHDGSWLKKTLSALSSGSILAAKGILAAETAVAVSLDLASDWQLLKSKSYGESRISLWQSAASAGATES